LKFQCSVEAIDVITDKMLQFDGWDQIDQALIPTK